MHLVPAAILSAASVSLVRFPVYAAVGTVVTAEHSAGDFNFFRLHTLSSFPNVYLNEEDRILFCVLNDDVHYQSSSSSSDSDFNSALIFLATHLAI